MYQKINIYRSFIIATISLIMPLLYIHYTANTINPFYLNGKQFLYFFSLLTTTAFVTGFIWKMLSQKQAADNAVAAEKHRLLQPKHCIALVLLIGFARLFQGFSNHKPVGYLMLLLLLNIGLYQFMRFRQNAH